MHQPYQQPGLHHRICSILDGRRLPVRWWGRLGRIITTDGTHGWLHSPEPMHLTYMTHPPLHHVHSLPCAAHDFVLSSPSAICHLPSAVCRLPPLDKSHSDNRSAAASSPCCDAWVPAASYHRILVDTLLPLLLQPLPVYGQALAFEYYTNHRIFAQKPTRFRPHIALPPSPHSRPPFSPVHAHPSTHTPSTPSSCSSPSSPPC
jgi:hypothetical protein